MKLARAETAAQAMRALRASIDTYSAVSDATWRALGAICRVEDVPRGHILYPAGAIPTSFAFVYRGLFRVYVMDDKGNEYNKNFFDEGKYPGPMVALLTATRSEATIEALEDATVVSIDFRGYRRLLSASDDLKMYHIRYLEQNWLLAKDSREIALVQDDATRRYLAFLDNHGAIAGRIPQYHIASHLGITPTQLSRIRKTLE